MIQAPQFQPPTPRTRKNGQGIHEKFEACVAQNPGAPALTWLHNTLSYREVNERANRLAHFLINAGVGPEVPVALYLERSVDMVIAILAVLKAGGVYVPIDLVYPEDRVKFMLSDSGAALLVTQSKLRASLPHSTKIVELDTLDAELASGVITDPEVSVSPDNAAYVMYTSGSTGQPKGVVVTHHNVLRLFTTSERLFHFSNTDVWALFHSYAFDMSVWEIWGAFFHGGRLAVVPQLTTRSPQDFYAFLESENITFLNQTPSAFRQLIWAESASPLKRRLSLRFVTCGGEALDLHSLQPWFDVHGDQSPVIVNMYGITETTVHSTFRPIRQSDLVSGVGSVIGSPLPDVSIYLLDEALQPVAAGIPGEICVSGPGVARGYLNRPELTNTRFVRDPFTPSGRIYRSGDLARVNAFGEMEYIGRRDHQLKIRGFRVEAGEIEAALNDHPAVRASVVLARDIAIGEKQLIAYIVLKAQGVSVSQLRSSISRRLPEYMVPSAFVFLDAFPLNHNGKVDRNALPAPDGSRPNLTTPFSAPDGITEHMLSQIWAEVLRVDQVGRNDNFFELGGDSIRGISMIAKAADIGLKLSLAQLFENPTLASLAKSVVFGAAPVERTVDAFALLTAEDRSRIPEGVVDAYPVAALQLGMFFHNELDPRSAVYHDVFSFQISARFDGQKLFRCLNNLVARHSILRTSFHLSGFSRALQFVHVSAEPTFTVEDLCGLSEHDQKASAIRWIQVEKRIPFDRATAPLARFHAQIRGENCFQFFFSFHHCCIDGWSLAQAMTELLVEYDAMLVGRTPVTSPPACHYRDFIAREMADCQSHNSRNFWKNRLQACEFPQFPRWPESLREGGREQVRGPEMFVEPVTLSQLRDLSRKLGVPLKSVLLAVHLKVMSFLYGRDDLVTGLVSNGRPELTDGERMLGLFLNTIPLPAKLTDQSWVDLVRNAFESEQQLMPYRRFPLAEIQKLIAKPLVLESAFDFVHFHVYKEIDECENVSFSEGPYFEANNLATYTTFILDLRSNRLEFHIDYDPARLCAAQVERLTGYYAEALTTIARYPFSKHNTFLPLSEEERRLTLLTGNRCIEPCSALTIDQLVEQCALRTPNATAVASGGKQLTYQQLMALAAETSDRLLNIGAKPGAPVGICLERGPEMVAAVLGILKTGSPYVPLDPGYPVERLTLMIEHGGVQAVVTSRLAASSLPERIVPLVLLDEPPVHPPHPNAPIARSSEDIAYIIFTSGSTGTPKAVQVAHRSVVNVLTSVARRIGFSEKDHLLAVTTLSFDIAALEIFMPLISGASLTLASSQESLNGRALADLLRESGASVMQATPITWRMLIESDWTGSPDLQILCGGEPLKPDLAAALLLRAKSVWNMYGPTETTIWSTCWRVLADQPVSIGTPLGNTEVYVLDSRHNPVPVGTPGELFIGGLGLALGYRGQPVLTSERFLELGPGGILPRRLYRTGDIARFLPSGDLECLGRTDQQVKVRGFRIEPAEVETVLKQYPAITDAVVAAREHPSGEKRLVGYLVSKNGPLPLTAVREFARAKLPPHMVPGQFVVLERLPLTLNGKIDYKQLPNPEPTPIASAYLPPSSPTELKLVKIWQEVLSVSRIGVEDDFFELGGDSLSATRAFVRINETFSYDLSLRQLFDCRTIRALAGILESEGTQKRLTVPIRVRPRLTG